MSIQRMIENGEATTLIVATPLMLREFALSMIRMVSETNKAQAEEPRYTPDEFAKRKGVNKSTLHRWVKAGILRQTRVGGRVFYRDSDLMEG